jgi:small-conductance mechanosensitive channel
MDDLHQAFPWLFEFLRSALPQSMHRYIDAALIILVVTLVGVLVRVVLVAWMERSAKRTQNIYDDIIVNAFRRRTIVSFFLFSVYLALPELPLKQRVIDPAQTFVFGLLIAIATMATSKILSSAVTRYASSTGTGLGGTTLIKYIIRFFVYAIGIIALFTLFEIPLAPYIAAFGVGGLAVALAFQDTLANLFAGIYITLSQQIRIGDYIELSSKEEGFVTDIGWRTTSIRTMQNNIIIIPNKKLGDAIITNYHLPETRLSIEVAVGVSYDCDPYRVEEVLLDEAARAAGVVDGVMADPPAVVRFQQFADSSLNFKMFMSVNDFSFKFSARHEMMKRIYRRFRQEGIEIPFPIRTIHLPEGTAKELSIMKNGQ